MELLIVIGILVVLTVTVVLVLNPNQLISNAGEKVTQIKLNELADTTFRIKGFTGKTAEQITASGCTKCVFSATTPLN